jgi:multifunctional beta-oxidation protein
MSLSFKGRVVVVTGAGAGLGRAYASEFAKRGAQVVVNDLGGKKSGEGSSTSAADSVVSEIVAAGAVAVADYNSVTDGERIIETAIKRFGRIDVLINNAGILRDVTLSKMNSADWKLVHDVHLNGTFACTHAAWKYMTQQNYGRIINVTSVAGLYGNIGQANYSSAKSAIVGFTKTIAKEGVRFNIKANVIAPMATSRLTEKILPDEIKPFTAPEFVAPIVTLLSHESCPDNGEIIEVAAGWIAKVRYQRAKGVFLKPPFSAEDALKKWSGTSNYSTPDYPQEIHETIMICVQNANEHGGKSKL